MTTGIKLCSSVFFLALLLSMASPVYSQGEVASIDVVVSANNTSIQSLSEKQLRKLFLGKSLKLSDGTRAILVTYKPLHKLFNKIALRRSNAQVQAAWSRLKFSGRSNEPKIFKTAQALIKFVSENLNAIGYVPTSELTAEVRSVLTLTN